MLPELSVTGPDTTSEELALSSEALAGLIRGLAYAPAKVHGIAKPETILVLMGLLTAVTNGWARIDGRGPGLQISITPAGRAWLAEQDEALGQRRQIDLAQPTAH